MNGKVLSLAVLLLAGAASGALAQDHGGPDRDGGGRPQIQNGGPMYNAARQAQAQAHRQSQQQARPPQAAQPPQAQPPARPPEGAHFRQDGRGPSGWSRQGGGRPEGAGRPGFTPPPGGSPGQAARPDDDRRGWNQHGGGGGRGPDRPGSDRNNGDRNYSDRNYSDRSHGDRHDGGPPVTRAPDHRADDQWRRADGRGDWNRDHDRRPGNGPRWAPRRYPPVYNSPARFRAPYWRAPVGYYSRAWRYGEVLPYGWYGPDYTLVDWWDYQLPEPPPGYDWVRVGRDALLVDYTGRIFQVVRLLFW